MLYSIDLPNFIAYFPLLLEILGNICIAILCYPGCEVMDFEINLIFLIEPFFLHLSLVGTYCLKGRRLTMFVCKFSLTIFITTSNCWIRKDASHVHMYRCVSISTLLHLDIFCFLSCVHVGKQICPCDPAASGILP